MKLFVWLLRAMVFLILLGLSITNTQEVELVLAGYVWHAPLILVGLVFFLVGLLLGWLFTRLAIFPRQLEIKRLKRELHELRELKPALAVQQSETPPLPPLA